MMHAKLKSDIYGIMPYNYADAGYARALMYAGETVVLFARYRDESNQMIYCVARLDMDEPRMMRVYEKDLGEINDASGWRGVSGMGCGTAHDIMRTDYIDESLVNAFFESDGDIEDIDVQKQLLRAIDHGVRKYLERTPAIECVHIPRPNLILSGSEDAPVMYHLGSYENFLFSDSTELLVLDGYFLRHENDFSRMLFLELEKNGHIVGRQLIGEEKKTLLISDAEYFLEQQPNRKELLKGLLENNDWCNICFTFHEETDVIKDLEKLGVESLQYQYNVGWWR